MIFSPLPGTPIITQGLGQNPDIYSQWGLDGHNGLDFGVDIGTTVYAPHDGIATIQDDGDQNYGLYIVINADKRRSILAHMSQSSVANGQFIYQGDPIGLSGDSGYSTNPHLHWTYKVMQDGWVQNKDNGYDGAVDVSEFTRLWLDQDMHFDSTYTDDAQEYLAMNFASNVYMKNPARTA